MSQPSEESSPEKLPPEMVGEILSRVPTKSLARFRAVCKRWNKTIWEDKSFVNNYLSHTRPQFILRNKSQMCSVEINLDDDNDHVSPIEVRELTLDLPCGLHTITSLVYCDGFLLSGIWKKGFVLWNPWVEHTRWIMSNTHDYRFCGVGYDKTRPESGYKIFGYDFCFDATHKLYPKVVIYECKTDTWKFVKFPCEVDWYVPKLDSIVSMSGNLFWIAYDSKTYEHYIRCFDFSKEIFKTFCVIPSNNVEDLSYTQALAVFRRDRFSLLRQSFYPSNKVEILVTKNNIDGNGEAVEWINLMIVSDIPNFPRLQHKCLDSQPSYFIDNVDDKKLVVCACDEKGRACIYIVKGDVFRKILIDVVVDVWPSHLTYVPSFVSVPNSSQRKEERLQKKEILVKSFM